LIISFKIYAKKAGYIDIIGRKNENGVLIRIEDSGCGIPEEDLPRVKQRFFKGSNVVSGSGLGLAICDEIVKTSQWENRHRKALSEKGTRVDVILPV